MLEVQNTIKLSRPVALLLDAVCTLIDMDMMHLRLFFVALGFA